MLPGRLQFKGANIRRTDYNPGTKCHTAALSGPVRSRRRTRLPSQVPYGQGGAFVFFFTQANPVPRRVCLLWGTSYFLTLTVMSAGI